MNGGAVPETDTVETAAPEVRALLAAARRSLERAVQADLPSEFDPSQVARLARLHALDGLVHRGMERLADSGSGPAAQAREVLHAHAFGAVAGNLRRIAELHRVVGLLAREGVPLLALKGPVLSMQAYGDPHLRSYGDVDILVARERAGNVIDLLLASGYVDRREGRAGPPDSARWHDWGFTAPDGETLVEVHWKMVRPARFPAVESEEAWDRPIRVEVHGWEVPAPRVEVILPYVCIHGSRDAWGRLELPASIAGLIGRNPELDWDEVLRRAERWRVRRILAVGVALADQLFGTGPPPGVRTDLLWDGTTQRIAGRFRDTLLNGIGRTSRGRAEALWLQVRTRDSLADGIALGRTLLLSPSPAEWEPEPGSAPLGWALGPLRRVRRLVSGS